MTNQCQLGITGIVRLQSSPMIAGVHILYGSCGYFRYYRNRPWADQPHWKVHWGKPDQWNQIDIRWVDALRLLLRRRANRRDSFRHQQKTASYQRTCKALHQMDLQSKLERHPGPHLNFCQRMAASLCGGLTSTADKSLWTWTGSNDWWARIVSLIRLLCASLSKLSEVRLAGQDTSQ